MDSIEGKIKGKLFANRSDHCQKKNDNRNVVILFLYMNFIHSFIHSSVIFWFFPSSSDEWMLMFQCYWSRKQQQQQMLDMDIDIDDDDDNKK